MYLIRNYHKVKLKGYFNKVLEYVKEIGIQNEIIKLLDSDKDI